MYLQKKARVRYALRVLTIKQVNLHTSKHTPLLSATQTL